MAISFSRFVSITSGVGAGATVRERELITRIFTDNALVPPKTVLEFESAVDVGTYFGTSTEEYSRAQFYFAWVSKNITSAQKISFARWVDSATPAKIFGKPATYVLGTFTAITSGGFNLTLGGFTFAVAGINLSAAGSLSAVAADIQTAIRAESGGGTDWTSATVSYDSSRGSFDLVGGVAGAEPIAISAASSGTDLAGPLGWLTGAIVAQGSAVETITQTLVNSVAASNNFGSFLFMPSLSTDQITEAATWNDGQNVDYMYLVPVDSSNASAVSAALFNLAGSAITLAPLSDEYAEMVPGMVEAATDYSQRNSTQNYMFQIFDLTPSVTSDADADTYDNLRVNYYGQTQTAGQFIQFYQRGTMTGLPVDPVDQNIYANEQWFKDAMASSIMTLLLALPKVSANATGRSQLLAIVQDVINQALFNGTISTGKTLTVAQQLFITNATGDPKAWYQVQTIGYWVDAQIVSYTTEDGRTEYKAVYTLIYSKNDTIRKVTGRDILI